VAERIFVDDLFAFTDKINGRRKLARVNVLLQQPRKLFVPRGHKNVSRKGARKTQSRKT
jgi:hypothetical protein